MIKAATSIAAAILLLGIALALPQQKNANADDSFDFLSRLQISQRLKQALTDIINAMKGILTNQYAVSTTTLAKGFRDLSDALGSDIDKMDLIMPNLKSNFTNFVNGLSNMAASRGQKNVEVADLRNVNGVFIGDMEGPFRTFLMRTYSKTTATQSGATGAKNVRTQTG